MVNPVDLGDERNVSQIGRMLVFDSRTALRRLLRWMTSPGGVLKSPSECQVELSRKSINNIVNQTETWKILFRLVTKIALRVKSL